MLLLEIIPILFLRLAKFLMFIANSLCSFNFAIRFVHIASYIEDLCPSRVLLSGLDATQKK